MQFKKEIKNYTLSSAFKIFNTNMNIPTKHFISQRVAFWPRTKLIDAQFIPKIQSSGSQNPLQQHSL